MQIIIAIAAAVLIGLAALLIGAAANSEEFGEHDHDHNGTSQAKLKIAVAFEESNPHYESILKFKSEVEEKSGGSISVGIYGSGKLGNDKDLVNSIKDKENKVDIVVTSVENFTDVDPRMDISTLPFIFSSYEDAVAFVEGDVQESIEVGLQKKNIRILSHYSDGFEYITSIGQMIMKATDVKNMSFAVDKGSDMAAVMSKLGAIVHPVEAEAIPHVVGSGVYNGYIGSLDTIMSGNLYSSQKNLAVTYHRYNALAFAISEEAWNSLTESEQKIVLTAAEESAHQDRSKEKETAENTLKRLEANGMKITYPNLLSFVREVESYIISLKSKYGDLINDVIENMNE